MINFYDLKVNNLNIFKIKKCSLNILIIVCSCRKYISICYAKLRKDLFQGKHTFKSILMFLKTSFGSKKDDQN